MFHINNATHLVIKSNYYGLIIHQIFVLSHAYDWSKHDLPHNWIFPCQNWRISKWYSPISETVYIAKNIWTMQWRYSIHLWTFSCSSKPLIPFLELCSWKTDNVHGRISKIIIHQIFLLVRDWPKHVTWSNIPQLKLGNIQEYSPILKTACVAIINTIASILGENILGYCPWASSVPRSQFSLSYALGKLFVSQNR